MTWSGMSRIGRGSRCKSMIHGCVPIHFDHFIDVALIFYSRKCYIQIHDGDWHDVFWVACSIINKIFVNLIGKLIP